MKVFKRRNIIQGIFVLITNSYFVGFIKGSIYTGSLKTACLPGLNCYSCPGALGSCPIGALQIFTGARTFSFPLYITGTLIITGGLLGRFVCGFLCPFGLVQDLVYRIPFLKKDGRLPFDKFLRFVPYVILAAFVILIPMLILDISGLGSPAFCKYICPSGTLGAGIPLVIANKSVAASIGLNFIWKIGLLVLILFLSLMYYRPFCRYICPLGAIYGFFNPISVLGFEIDKSTCTTCGKCKKTCKWEIDVVKTPNSQQCIRCGDCFEACPNHSIKIKSISSKRCIIKSGD